MGRDCQLVLLFCTGLQCKGVIPCVRVYLRASMAAKGVKGGSIAGRYRLVLGKARGVQL